MTRSAVGARLRAVPAEVASSRLAFPAAVALPLGAMTGLLLWDVSRFGWLRGYDAFDAARYADVIQRHGHLPGYGDTNIWHNPPLFYALAALIQKLAAAVGWPHDPQSAVLLVSVASGIGVAALAFLLARELFPSSRTAQLGALAFAVLTPVLVRGSLMYHPEPLAALLSTAGLYVVVRAFRRGSTGLGSGLAAGVLLGLANLTRSWALAALAAALLALAADYAWRRQRRTLVAAAALFVACAALTAPWFAYEWSERGSPLAYGRTNPAQWTLRGRPLEFYTGVSLGDVFRHPYAPRFRNRLLPVVYTDWWGDYWRYFDLPETLREQPEQLPGKLHRERVLQSYAGLLPTALFLAGFVGLAVLGVRRRQPALVALTGALVVLFASFVGFLVKYPKVDGDNIKALYLLNAAAPLAVCGGWALSRARRAGGLVFAALLLLLLEAAFLDLRFLVL